MQVRFEGVQWCRASKTDLQASEVSRSPQPAFSPLPTQDTPAWALGGDAKLVASFDASVDATERTCGGDGPKVVTFTQRTASQGLPTAKCSEAVAGLDNTCRMIRCRHTKSSRTCAKFMPPIILCPAET